jgi:hypothetical protein
MHGLALKDKPLCMIAYLVVATKAHMPRFATAYALLRGLAQGLAAYFYELLEKKE